MIIFVLSSQVDSLFTSSKKIQFSTVGALSGLRIEAYCCLYDLGGSQKKIYMIVEIISTIE